MIETILVYKLPQLTREEIQAILHLPDIDLKQTRFYQQAVAEGREEDGQHEAAALVRRLLRRRLGALEVEQEARIQTLPVLELEALAEALLEFKTANEFDGLAPAAALTGSAVEIRMIRSPTGKTIAPGDRFSDQFAWLNGGHPCAKHKQSVGVSVSRWREQRDAP